MGQAMPKTWLMPVGGEIATKELTSVHSTLKLDRSVFYSPRTQQWSDHFRCQEIWINGITPEGRTTVYLLKLNSTERVTERQRLTLES